MTDAPQYIWPDVVNQQLDAPYCPDVPAADRRECAIADGMMMWALAISAVRPPPQFWHVLIKLAGIAGASPPDLGGFTRAADTLSTRGDTP